MSLALVTSLAISAAPIIPKEVCTAPQSEKDADSCFILRMLGIDEMRTAETIAVAKRDEIPIIRKRVRECGLVHRVDPVGERVAVIDIFNAEQEQRDCLVSWIEATDPQYLFSDERLDAALKEAHADHEGTDQ